MGGCSVCCLPTHCCKCFRVLPAQTHCWECFHVLPAHIAWSISMCYVPRHIAASISVCYLPYTSLGVYFRVLPTHIHRWEYYRVLPTHRHRWEYSRVLPAQKPSRRNCLCCLKGDIVCDRPPTRAGRTPLCTLSRQRGGGDRGEVVVETEGRWRQGRWW